MVNTGYGTLKWTLYYFTYYIASIGQKDVRTKISTILFSYVDLGIYLVVLHFVRVLKMGFSGTYSESAEKPRFWAYILRVQSTFGLSLVYWNVELRSWSIFYKSAHVCLLKLRFLIIFPFLLCLILTISSRSVRHEKTNRCCGLFIIIIRKCLQF